MFIIKAIKDFFTWVVIIGGLISLSVYSCVSSCVSSCKSCQHEKLSDNLFNKTVLSYYDIPWLKKPENSTKKDCYQYEDDLKHVYQAYLQDEQSFWDYGEYIYDTFVKKDYTIGRCVSEGDMLILKDNVKVVELTNFEDCCKREITYALGEIEIFYSEKGLSSIYTKDRGYEMKRARRIKLLLMEKDEGLLLTITCCNESNRNVYMKK